MLKKTIKYLDFDGKEVENDFYFNLTKGEVAELQFQFPHGFEGFTNKLKESPEPGDIVKIFKAIILKAIGKRTVENGFVKSEDISNAFAATDAYSVLFLQFLDGDEDFATKFLEGCMNAPAGTLKKAIDTVKEDGTV